MCPAALVGQLRRFPENMFPGATSPRWGGGQEQRPGTKDTEVGYSFAEIALVLRTAMTPPVGRGAFL